MNDMPDHQITLEELSLRVLDKPATALDNAERRVLQSILEREPLARNVLDFTNEKISFGDRLADKVAAVGGSWSFIIAFVLVLFGWMLLNSRVLDTMGLAFDPFPYIFLNLMLSTLAAFQAPVIMMSQNRQAAKDRLAAQHDFEVNLRAELEIMRLHEKVDALRHEQEMVLERHQDRLIAAIAERLGIAAPPAGNGSAPKQG